MTERIGIVIADDHPLFRGGVIRSLHEDGGFEVLAECTSADDAVAATARVLPDIALLDISMPGNGLTAAERISEQFPTVRIIMLTVSEQDDDLLRALKAGASGYVLKGVAVETLIEALHSVHAGGSFISPGLAGKVLSAMGAGKTRNARVSDPISDLTHREEQILRLVARGASNREIGEELGLREATVKHYMSYILQKLHVRNRVEAALMAREKGL
ncbi:MAG: response regulator transcription factor [Roseovarius sp.]|uniref:response regulator n=1 Tax=Roseovarius sp. TaxID=1486281 RepID=UPI001996DBFC|nr:response regulator transcription factor [Roseovarius sp.]MBC7179664.1 response regulator transcription factor [Roseovarius sp.]MBQ0752351.1 response regulator transcription factor [Roseovarius sp.]MBQ0809501.1 response regulator transcription factor [Roseovarius sp.]